MVCNSKTEPVVKVGMAQFRIGSAPMKMITLALGSCLGIVLYDKAAKMGALAHVMHPSIKRVKNRCNRAKFVDTAIELMLEKMISGGAKKSRITAKLFGGAQMFQHVVGSRGVIQIGEANVMAARHELEAHGIPVLAECVGGNGGRTITFDVSDGSVAVRDAMNNEEIW